MEIYKLTHSLARTFKPKRRFSWPHLIWEKELIRPNPLLSIRLRRSIKLDFSRGYVSKCKPVRSAEEFVENDVKKAQCCGNSNGAYDE